MKNKLVILAIFFGISIQLSMKNKYEIKDIVPDETTAIKVAEAIWLPIYGERIYSQKPYVVKLINNNNWEVTGTLHSKKGGVAYIRIRKKDCKILKVTHGK